MISADDFCDALARRGIDVATGVPCSYLSGPISRLTQEGRYIPAANEGAAVALACGATAGGTRAAVFCQNSGFGNLINPLTSLQATYAIPLLVFMSLRGWPDPSQDEPQHEVMGAATHQLLDTLRVAYWTLESSLASLERILGEARAELESGRSAFVLIPKGCVGRADTSRRAEPDLGRLTSAHAIEVLLPRLRGMPVISTTGYISRSLFAAEDRPTHFYMQGSMGHAAAFGLGLALRERRQVAVLDGDGAALMHLGTMSTIGATAPIDLLHVIFDNQAYESTGLQATTSATTNFATVALGAGYASAHHCTSADEIWRALDAGLSRRGPHLLVIRVRPDPGEAPPRATSAVPAREIFTRFSSSVGAGSTWQRTPDAAAPPGRAHAKVMFGSGSLECLRSEVLRHAGRRILVVASERQFSAAEMGRHLAGLDVRLFSGFTSNPTVDDVLNGCRIRDSWEPDLFIGLGGGSAMDTAKAVRSLPCDRDLALAAVAGRAGNLVGDPSPLILIPTTAGTGSEVTQFATLFVGLEKVSLDHPSIAADRSIVDPLLTRHCPPKVMSSCMMDSLSHAVESLWSAHSVPESRIYAEQALQLLKKMLGQRFDALSLEQRNSLSLASLQAGRAIDITRTTAAHAFAYRLTSQFSVPHGVACMLNLRWLYDYNRQHVYSHCSDVRGGDFVHDHLMDIAKLLELSPGDVSSALSDLLAIGGWPIRLREYGVTSEDIDRLVWLGLGHAGRSDRNPVALDRKLVVDRLLQTL